MADFCKQCSIEIYGEDCKDLYDLNDGEKLKPGSGWKVLCEGCGITLVDNEGKCINKDCKKHGENK